jgi:outer membrane protein
MKTLFALLLCWSCFTSCAESADLLAAYRLALEHDPQLREANDTRLAVRELLPQAVAALLPQLNGSGSANRETDRGSQNQVETVQDAAGGPSFVESFPFNGNAATNRRQFGIDLRQSVFRWENWVALRRANTQAAAAEADYVVAQQDLMARVTQVYFDVLAGQDLIDAREASLESVNRQLMEAEARYDAGLIGIAEVEQARGAHDLAADAIIAAKRALSSSVERLREITGASFDRLARPIDELEPANPNPTSEQSWVNLALEQNPALVSSRLAATEAQERVTAAYGGHLPSVDLVASRYKSTSDSILTNADGSPFGSATQDQYQNKIGIQFTIPLVSGGLASSQVREAVYRHRAANERVLRVTYQIEHDARDAYIAVMSEISRVHSLHRALETNTRSLHAAELSYSAGTRAAVDVLESRRQWLQARTDYARSRYDYMLGISRLQQAAGMLSADTMKQLNSLLTDAPAPPSPVAPD